MAAIVTALPIITKVLPTDVAQHLFPPLGELEPLARLGAVAFALLSMYVAFFLGSGKATARVVSAAVVALLSFLTFLGLSSRLVRTVPVPSQNTSISVSVGFRRSDFAKSNFPNSSDWDMLRDRGLSDEQIDKLWTPNSVMIGRLALWTSCAGFIAASVFALCFGVLSQREEPSP